MATFSAPLATVMFATVAASEVLTRLALRYAKRARLLDQPGQRRSHAVPTPRGGGVGIVLVLVATSALLAMFGKLPVLPATAFAVGLVMVSGIGWIDDHRPLAALPRLFVHVVAAVLFVAVLPRDGDDIGRAFVVGAAQVFLLVGAINFWNFMDGIDGLITTQSIAVGLMSLLLFGLAVDPGWAMLSLAVTGAALGFLRFNFPRAKIFLGDVGSGGLGFACGALLLQAQAQGAVDALGALVAMSVIGIDATLTLLSRIVRGRRWYDPHREHLYQWLVRRGRSHARVTSLYLLWNVVVVLPVLALMRLLPAWSAALGVAALAAGTLAWFAGKRVLARRPA